jgi:spore coat protein U-like protein
VSGTSQTLNYNLYTSGAYTTVWGDGTASTGTVTGSGAGLLSTSPHTVHGRLFQGQDLPPAAYASTITVTVDY